MKTKPYVLLCNASSNSKCVLIVPFEKLELGFKVNSGNVKVWSVENKNGFYMGFCSLDTKDFKDASEITADSPEEYVLKLAAMGFIYGGEEEES